MILKLFAAYGIICAVLQLNEWLDSRYPGWYAKEISFKKKRPPQGETDELKRLIDFTHNSNIARTRMAQAVDRAKEFFKEKRPSIGETPSIEEFDRLVREALKEQESTPKKD